MNKNIGIIVGIVVLVVAVGGIYASMRDSDDAMEQDDHMEQKSMDDTKMDKENDEMTEADVTKTDTIMEKDETSMMDKSDTMMKVGTYEAYAPEKVTLASEEHDVVLFFRASWCPTCRALDADITANLSNIPASLAILDVDYDKSSELKQKYGVTYQHTFVKVDKDGNLLKKWSGSPTLSALVAEIK